MSLEGVTLRRVDDTDDVMEFKRWLGERRPVLAVDSETIGLEWYKNGFTRLVQMGDASTGWTIGVDLWKGLIDEALRSYDGPIVGHNTKFDLHALDAVGLHLPARHQLHDTFLMHGLLYPLKWHGLKPVSTDLIDPHANVPAKELDALMKRNKWTWATVPYECLGYSVYGALDTVLTARLYEILKPQIDARYSQAYEREMLTSLIMFETERRGLRLDIPYAERLHERYASEMEELLTKIQFYGVTNPNSARQIERALRLENWEPDVFTDTGAPSLAKKVLEKMDFEVASLILEYRWREKYSSYVAKMLKSHVNGVVFPSINTFEAKTGRMSIGTDKKERGTGEIVSIPFQQFPHNYDVRRCILPRSVEEEMYAVDYDSQELRVLAHYSQEQGLIDAIREGRDMHCYVGSQIYQEEITKADPRRNIAKMAQYLKVYGGGAAKLAGAVGIPLDEAERFMALYERTFPGVKALSQHIISAGKSHLQREGHAYVETWGGRRPEVDPPKWKDGEKIDFFYKLGNYIIQGSCSDLLKEKLIQLDSAGFTKYIDLPVHDELLFSIPADEPELIHEMASIMEEYRAFSVPLTVEITGPKASWGHCKLKPGQVGWDETAEVMECV